VVLARLVGGTLLCSSPVDLPVTGGANDTARFLEVGAEAEAEAAADVVSVVRGGAGDDRSALSSFCFFLIEV
jgi:hypothetical protein